MAAELQGQLIPTKKKKGVAGVTYATITHNATRAKTFSSLSTDTLKITVAAGTNNCAVFWWDCTGGATPTSVKWGTTDFTKVSGTFRESCWILVNVPTGAGVVTWAASSTTGACGVTVYNGVHQTVTTGTWASVEETSASTSLNVTTVAGDLVTSASQIYNTGVANASQTTRWSLMAGSGDGNVMSDKTATTTTTTMIVSWAGSRSHGTGAIPLKQAQN